MRHRIQIWVLGCCAGYFALHGDRANADVFLGIRNGHAYFLTDASTDPIAGRQLAAAYDGYLAAINDSGENEWLLSVLPSCCRYWIGFSDEVVEGAFQWDNGELVTYTNWLPGEPNDNFGLEDWTLFNAFDGGHWNDGQVVTQERCIIEVPCCVADFNCDGFANGVDFDLYVQAFEAGDPRADFDGDEFITGIDFDLYVQAFEEGCQ